MPHYGSGDAGMTGLPGGLRVPKSHPRVEACGDLDELCSVLGACAASLSEEQSLLREELRRIQGALLCIGARVAAGQDTVNPAAAVPSVLELDAAIDRMEAELPPMKSFILPGGHPSAAWAHVARTVCRRAERHVAALGAGHADAGHADAGACPQGTLQYLNRLSSYLFDLARLCNRARGIMETEWRG